MRVISRVTHGMSQSVANELDINLEKEVSFSIDNKKVSCFVFAFGKTNYISNSVQALIHYSDVILWLSAMNTES